MINVVYGIWGKNMIDIVFVLRRFYFCKKRYDMKDMKEVKIDVLLEIVVFWRYKSVMRENYGVDLVYMLWVGDRKVVFLIVNFIYLFN